MSPVRTMPCIGLVLPILFWTGAASEQRAEACQANGNCDDEVSLMQLRSDVKKAQEPGAEPCDMPSQPIHFEAGFPQQRVQVFMASETTSQPTTPTTTASEPVTTMVWTPPPGVNGPPVTIPPGQVKVSVYMEKVLQAVPDTTTTTTTLTMKIQILIGGNNPAPPPVAVQTSGTVPPTVAFNPQQTKEQQQAAISHAMDIQRQEGSALGGQPGTSGYGNQKHYIPPTPGRSGEIADINNEANQVLGGVGAPAPPPPYLSQHSVNEKERNQLGLASAAITNTTTIAPADLIHPLTDTSLSTSEEAARQKAAMDCQLSDWGGWSTCDTVSGDIVSSTQATRSREVIQPPQPGGEVCGVLTESRVCSGQ